MSQLSLEGTADYRPAYRAQIVQSLAELRREWETAASGKGLVDVQTSVGLILADIADRLELSPHERHTLLGGRLINQINCIREERVTAKLPS